MTNALSAIFPLLLLLDCIRINFQNQPLETGLCIGSPNEIPPAIVHFPLVPQGYISFISLDRICYFKIADCGAKMLASVTLTLLLIVPKNILLVSSSI